jgi:hypothetical protein
MAAFVKERWIDAATTAVNTNPEEVTGAKNFGLQVGVTGSPTITVVLDGSIDGTYWSPLVQTSDVGTVWSSGDRPVKYMRARIATLSGGTSPTVTVSAIAA